MKTRVAVLAIIVEDAASVPQLNDLLHENSEHNIGRMGIPYRAKKINVMSVAVDAPQDVTAALTGMADTGADIAKLAVMPHTAADAARLLEATACAMAARPGTPLITMSMGPLGAVTRFCGGAFGSCATFGVTSGTAASAPGQPPADLLKAKLITAHL